MNIDFLKGLSFGAIYAALVMLKDRGENLATKSCVVLGDGKHAEILRDLLASMGARVVGLLECDERDYKVVFVVDSHKISLADMQNLLSLQCKCLCEVGSRADECILDARALELILRARICYAPAILSIRLGEVVLDIASKKQVEFRPQELLKSMALRTIEQKDMDILQACDDLMQRVSAHAKAKLEPTNFILGTEILKMGCDDGLI